MNYLLHYQFRRNFGNSCIYRDVSSNCKMEVAVERFLLAQEVFCAVLFEANEVTKNNFDFLCSGNHSEDCLLFLSKKAMFLTA